MKFLPQTLINPVLSLQISRISFRLFIPLPWQSSWQSWISSGTSTFPKTFHLQGLNTGVILHHLSRQRASNTFSSAVKIRAMEQLVETFLFENKSYVGDQDWLTLLSWQHPHLFHHLPCNFNFQEPHPSFPRDQDPKWDPYFHCEGEVLVLHRPWTLDSDFLLPDWISRNTLVNMQILMHCKLVSLKHKHMHPVLSVNWNHSMTCLFHCRNSFY